jgi:hypothetical protein
MFAVRTEQRVQALLDLIQASAVPHRLDPQYSGAGVPDLSRVPGGQSFSIGLSIGESAERAAPGFYRHAAVPGWSWLPNQQTSRFY